MKRRAFLLSALLPAGCGYHVAGKADLLPKTLHTIAVPTFGNGTTRYRLTDRIPAAIAREFITRTRYQVIPDPTQADAVLNGVVANYFSFPITFDANKGRAAGVQLSVILQLTLRERTTGKVLYTNPYMEVRQRYEISTEQQAYFEESDAAIDRLSQEVARSVVSAVLEKF
jgi:Lipopolysaccharide-assembly